MMRIFGHNHRARTLHGSGTSLACLLSQGNNIRQPNLLLSSSCLLRLSSQITFCVYNSKITTNAATLFLTSTNTVNQKVNDLFTLYSFLPSPQEPECKFSEPPMWEHTFDWPGVSTSLRKSVLITALKGKTEICFGNMCSQLLYTASWISIYLEQKHELFLHPYTLTQLVSW